MSDETHERTPADMAATIARLTAEVERLTAEATDAAIALAALNSGEDLQRVMRDNERLWAARVAAEAEVGWLEAARAPEMADEITNLRAAQSKLESELADALTDLNTARQDNASFGPELKRLTAEVERLRAALQQTVPYVHQTPVSETVVAALNPERPALKEPRT